MKRYLPLLLLLLMLFIPALAEAEPTEYKSGDFGYILLDDGTAEITQYFGTDAVVHGIAYTYEDADSWLN